MCVILVAETPVILCGIWKQVCAFWKQLEAQIPKRGKRTLLFSLGKEKVVQGKEGAFLTSHREGAADARLKAPRSF